MVYADAIKILAANAACQLQDGCDCCPIYADTIAAGKPQGFCSEYTSYEKVKEAVELIKQVGVLNSASAL